MHNQYLYHIHVAADLCMEQFAPNPAGAERVCSELESGDVQCSYTCTEPNALIYQYSTQLSSTATSTCSNSTIGYQPVKDCIGMYVQA